MTKPELGTKRLCARCGAKFYDLHHSPITCPKCSAVFEPVDVNKRFHSGTASKPKSDFEPVVAEAPEAEFTSLEDADAEAGDGQRSGVVPEAEDEVEPDDESLDDAALIEESEQEDTDVSAVLGDDIEIEDKKTED
jgi:uncharacterized protein (TIGR02300 family)